MATEIKVDPVDEFGEEGDLSASEILQTQKNAKNILGLLNDKVKQLELAETQGKAQHSVPIVPIIDTNSLADEELSDVDKTPTLTKKQKKKMMKIKNKSSDTKPGLDTSAETTKEMSGGLSSDLTTVPEPKLDWADNMVEDDKPNEVIEEHSEPESGSDAEAFNSSLSREELISLVNAQSVIIERRNNQVDQLMAKIKETDEFARSLKNKVDVMEIDFQKQFREMLSIQTQILSELAVQPKYPALPVTPILGSVAATSEYSEIAPSQVSEAPLPPVPSSQFQRSFVFEE